MSDREVSARITARNETGAGVAEAKASIESLGAVTAGTTAKMKEHFAGVSASVRVMGVNIRESFAAMSEMRELLTHLAEAALAAFAVEKVAEWAREMGEAAERTTHLAQTFGVSVGQIQQLGGVAKATGIGLDTITRGLGIFDKNMITAAGSTGTAGRALAAVGIHAASSATQMQLLTHVAERFKNMDDGPKKVALAMSLFGKSGKELIPILNLGAEGLAEINKKSAEYGVVNEVAVAKGMALAESVNESKLAMAGLGNVMTDAFAPMLKEATDSMNSLIAALIESYNSGGVAKQGLEIVTGTLEILGTALSQTGQLLDDLWSLFGDATGSMASDAQDSFGNKIPHSMTMTETVMMDLKGIFMAVGAAIQTVIEIIVLAFENFGLAVWQILKFVYDLFTSNDWGAVAANWQAGLDRIVKVNSDAADQINVIWKGVAAYTGMPTNDGSMHTNPKPKGGFDFKPSGGGGAKKGGGRHKESNLMQEWRTELATQLADEKNWGADEAQFALDFWNKKLAIAKKGSKEILEAEREVARAKIALFKEGQAEDIAGLKALEAAKLDKVKADMALERQALQNSLAMIDARKNAGKISDQQALRQKADVSRELYQIDADEEDAEYRIHLDSLNAQLALDHLKPKQRADINRQIYGLQVQHENKMRVLAGQTAQKELADQRAVMAARRQNMQQLSGTWASTLAKMATLQQGFMGTIRGLWQGLVSVVEGVLQQIIAKFIMAQLVKIGLVKAEAAATVPALAAQAGAGGVASMAAAPWPLDMTAPAFGASMAAAALAFAPGAMALGGWDVPASAGMGLDGRGGMSAIIHPREMVLPADLADVVRGGGSGGGPAIHIHAVDAQSVRRLFENHHGALASALRKHQRMGGRA